MRVLTVVATLLVTPALAAVAQNAGQAATGASAAGQCATADAKRSPTAVSQAGQAQDPKARTRVGCSPAAPVTTPPAPPPPPPPPPASNSAIDGSVYYDMEGRPGLPGWVVELTGAVNATAVTDSWGRYVFTGLPAGTYTVCEQLQVSWMQTFPNQGTSCPGGFGYSFTLDGSNSGSAVSFGNTIRLF